MATARRFDWQSTTDQVLEGIDLGGKVAIVTGASGGLGAETARALAARGAAVTLTARDTRRPSRWPGMIRGSHPGARLSRALARARPARQRARLREELAGRAARAPPAAEQRGRDGLPARTHARGLGAAVRDEPPRSLPADGAARARAARGAADRAWPTPARAATASRRSCSRTSTSNAGPTTSGLAYGQAKSANVLHAVELDRRLAPPACAPSASTRA